MMTMGAGSTRSGCFRSADACPAWMQIDTDRYLPGGYLGTLEGVRIDAGAASTARAGLPSHTGTPGHAAAKPSLLARPLLPAWSCPAPGPLPWPLPSQPACSTHDVTGKACHCPQVTFPVSAGQQSQNGKVWKVGKVGKAARAGKADPDSCISFYFIFFFCFRSPLCPFLPFVTEER